MSLPVCVCLCHSLSVILIIVSTAAEAHYSTFPSSLLLLLFLVVKMSHVLSTGWLITLTISFSVSVSLCQNPKNSLTDKQICHFVAWVERSSTNIQARHTSDRKHSFIPRMHRPNSGRQNEKERRKCDLVSQAAWLFALLYYGNCPAAVAALTGGQSVICLPTFLTAGHHSALTFLPLLHLLLTIEYFATALLLFQLEHRQQAGYLAVAHVVAQCVFGHFYLLVVVIDVLLCLLPHCGHLA